MLIPVGHLALEAVMALIIEDLTRGLDRGNLALVTTGLAGCATITTPAQPVKDPEARGETETRAQGTQVLAVEFAVNGRDSQ